MEDASQRKVILHSLWEDRIGPVISAVGRTFGREDNSSVTKTQNGTEPAPGGWRGSGGSANQRLLSPEERILELLAERDGGMKQGEIVSNTPWSDSTVSRNLQTLESTGDITRYRLGREKLVYLTGQEPPSLKSTFGQSES